MVNYLKTSCGEFTVTPEVEINTNPLTKSAQYVDNLCIDSLDNFDLLSATMTPLTSDRGVLKRVLEPGVEMFDETDKLWSNLTYILIIYCSFIIYYQKNTKKCFIRS